jgi:hypothetical protein
VAVNPVSGQTAATPFQVQVLLPHVKSAKLAFESDGFVTKLLKAVITFS